MTNNGTPSGLARLRKYDDQEEHVCPGYGYGDDEGAWEKESDGGVVEYSHESPHCGAVREHTLDLYDE